MPTAASLAGLDFGLAQEILEFSARLKQDPTDVEALVKRGSALADLEKYFKTEIALLLTIKSQQNSIQRIKKPTLRWPDWALRTGRPITESQFVRGLAPEPEVPRGHRRRPARSPLTSQTL